MDLCVGCGQYPENCECEVSKGSFEYPTDDELCCGRCGTPSYEPDPDCEECFPDDS